MRRNVSMLLCFALLVMMLSGCATTKPSPKPYEVTPKGTVVYGGEFEFVLPPSGWNIFWPEGDGSTEFAFGFIKSDPGGFPSQSVFAYDEEPFGTSTDLDVREKEFLKRFLWNAILTFETLEKKKVQVLGGEGLEVLVEGKNLISKEKAKAKIIFGKRGGRVVAFYITQWRPMDGTYDPSAFEIFDNFVASFKFLKKSFYETL